MSILSFANILCKTNLLNDYSNSLNESNPNQTLRSLTNHNSRELAFPSTIEADPNATPLSSLGSGSSGALIQIGNGKYIPGAVAKRMVIFFIAIFRSILIIHSSYVIFIP